MSTVEGKMQPAERIKKEIARLYDANPLGWSVLVGKDSRNFSQVLVSHGPKIWILKEEWINPYKSVGFGVRLEGGGELLKSDGLQQYGLRPLNRKQIKELTNLMEREEDLREFLMKVIKSKPVPSRDARSPLIVQGPIMATSNPLSLLSDSHRELDIKLREQLEKLLLRKYPQTLLPYL
ncbi:MAG: hypothetical protein ACUVTM_05820 [Candidatus Bathyarchaeia archaeon]